jgi:hypothetical protein
MAKVRGRASISRTLRLGLPGRALRVSVARGKGRHGKPAPVRGHYVGDIWKLVEVVMW